MAYLEIVKDGDPILRKVSRPVEEITPRILQLLDDMTATMRRADGCGLAAVQVGVLRRVVVVDTGKEILELINPQIISQSGKQIQPEGCLSFPGKHGNVLRPKKVVVRALDRNGKEQEWKASDFLARAFCHEIDHLDGKLFIDSLVGELEYNS